MPLDFPRSPPKGVPGTAVAIHRFPSPLASRIIGHIVASCPPAPQLLQNIADHLLRLALPGHNQKHGEARQSSSRVAPWIPADCAGQPFRFTAEPELGLIAMRAGLRLANWLEPKKLEPKWLEPKCHMGLCLPYHRTHHKYLTYRIGLATCIKSCMCSSFRRAPSHEAYVFHSRSTSRSVAFGHVPDSIIGSLVFLEPWCVFITRLWKFPTRSQNDPKQFPTILKHNSENESSQPMN